MSTAHDVSSTAHDSTAAAPQSAQPVGPQRTAPLPLPLPTVSRLLADPAIRGRGNGPVRQAAILQMQRTQGNRATQRLLQRRLHPGLDGASRLGAAQPQPASRAIASVQRLPTAPLTLQREITDDAGDDIDFADEENWPDWFEALSITNQGKVIKEDKRLTKAGQSKHYTTVLNDLGIAVKKQKIDPDVDYSFKSPKRTSAGGNLFNTVYDVKSLPRTGSGLGLITDCQEPTCVKPTRELILEKGTHHERGYADHKGRTQRPPMCHPDDLPAAHGLGALEDLVKASHPNPTAYMLMPTYTSMKHDVEWALPTISRGHHECNSKNKVTPWKKLKPVTQTRVKTDVLKFLVGRGYVDTTTKPYKWQL